MPTDFFQRQDEARRKTGWLVWLFLLAVLAVVGGTYAAAWAGCVYFAGHPSAVQGTQPPELEHVPLIAAAAAAALIVLGSLFKIAELRGGGTTVAERVGGQRVYPNTTDVVEKRVLNVVEEMAIASGVPVPPVFMLRDEQGINAFAAGYSPSDAVVGITRGCAEQLSRDQLQGVIAHEFSHIFNGDMRLNIRLIGVLHGILLLGLIGQMLFRIAAYSGRGSRNKKGGGAYILLIGLALVILGYLGTVLGNLIKAAVSRQREYLADASAVQFTRNPDGIAGALKRIGGLVFGSTIGHRNAAEASHMYFAEGVRVGLTSLLSTHPPLPSRIRRLDPQWDGKFPKVTATATGAATPALGAAGFVGQAAPAGGAPLATADIEHAADQAGSPRDAHEHYAARLLADLPPGILDAVHEAYSARALLYALLIDRDADVRAAQLKLLDQLAQPDVAELTRRLLPAVARLDTRAWLPLVDLALPTLRTMTAAQYSDFERCFVQLVRADEKIGLFEWTLHRILLRHLRTQFAKRQRPRISYYGLQRLDKPCSVLLSALAYVGHSPAAAAQAIEAARKVLPEVDLQLLSSDEPRGWQLDELHKALDQLSQVAPKHLSRLIDACEAVVCYDHKVTVREAELLRGICDMLDCPMPPLLPGQTVDAPTGSADTASRAQQPSVSS